MKVQRMIGITGETYVHPYGSAIRFNGGSPALIGGDHTLWAINAPERFGTWDTHAERVQYTRRYFEG